MKIELPIQQDTCKSCGMPYGSPQRELSATRFYCVRCANLPQNIMDVLDQHCRQLAQKAEEVKSPVSDAEPPAK